MNTHAAGKLACKLTLYMLLIPELYWLFEETRGDFANGILFFIKVQLSAFTISFYVILFVSTYFLGRSVARMIADGKSYWIIGLGHGLLESVIILSFWLSIAAANGIADSFLSSAAMSALFIVLPMLLIWVVTAYRIMSKNKITPAKSEIILVAEGTEMDHEPITTWMANGYQVRCLTRYQVKNNKLSGKRIAIYGNQTFAFTLAQLYDVELLSPDDTLIAKLDTKWTKRKIRSAQIKELVENDFPVFVKPVVSWIFPAGVFESLAAFKDVVRELNENEPVLVSSIVDTLEAEARAFILDGEIKDIALYEGYKGLEDGSIFLKSFLAENKQHLPKSVIVDIAYNSQIGWFVLDFSACWRPGLNGCDEEKVIDCIIAATVNQ